MGVARRQAIAAQDSRARDARAFTLLEMLLAVMILGILVSVAIPSAGGSFHHLSVKDAALTMASNIRYAQAYAVHHGRPVRLQVDKEKATYQLETLTGVGPAQQYTPLPFPAGGVFELPRNVKFQSLEVAGGSPAADTVTFLFEPDGRSQTGSIRIAGRNSAFDVIIGQAKADAVQAHLNAAEGG